jgi:hypothetical protein
VSPYTATPYLGGGGGEKKMTFFFIHTFIISIVKSLMPLGVAPATKIWGKNYAQKLF